MRLTRIHVAVALAIDQPATLSRAASLHVTRVLRLAVGTKIVLFDGRGGEYDGEIQQTTRAGVTVLPTQHRLIEREADSHITLVQALTRGEKMDWIVQKATELGVARIVPVALERSVVKLDDHQAEKRHAHWLAVAINACEQCGRNRLPEIAAPCALSAALETAADGESDNSCQHLRVLLDPAAADSLDAYVLPLRASSASSVLIGPEGGLTDAEIAAARAAGFVAVNFGPRILRTETAAIAALSVLQFLAGPRSPD